jgi:excisionase family DNA binding protein
MSRRPATTPDDPYDALADAIRAVAEDIVARMVDAVKPGSESDGSVMVSMPEAARRMGIGTTKLKELLAAGEIPSVKVGDRRLVPVSGLEAFTSGQLDGEKLTPKSSRVYPADAVKRGRSPRVVPGR